MGVLRLNGKAYGGGIDVIEVTQAQYNALPESKLSDDILYVISDSVNGSDGYPPLIYSFEEREIGVWEDGKPLYQKTFDFGSISGSSAKKKDLASLNIDYIASFIGTGKNNYNEIISIPFAHTTSPSQEQAFCRYNGDKSLGVYTGSNVIFTSCFISLQYTKTTDTKGSGKWTTQGTLAQHYSTTERLIGTWINGKPLYEKTFTPTSPTTANQVTVIQDITSLNIDVPVDIRGNILNVPINWNLDASNGTTCFVNSAKTGIAMKVINNLLTNITCNITLQYTKTTD